MISRKVLESLLSRTSSQGFYTRFRMSLFSYFAKSDVLQLLVEWADASINKSVNQPLRPHVIIVLNAVEMTADDKQWKSQYGTKKLLEDYKDSVHKLRRLKEILLTIKASSPIGTTEDLLKHYYTSITVLKIPHKGCYMQIDKQLMDLHKIISDKCTDSYTVKKEIRMLLNAERLPRYVNAAYDHFTQYLDEPFDFVTEARRHLPPPQDFGGHVLNFILFMYDQLETSKISIIGLFNRLSSPIASCIMLAAMRDKTQGTFSSLLQDTYKTPLEDAVSDFCYKWLRCSYKKEGISCMNTQSSHEKGHQSRKGVIFARGSYISPFQYPKSFEFWINEIQKAIKGLENTLHNANKDEGSVIPNIHRDIMKTFYNTVPSASNFRSQLTCVCCIGKIPEYVLPCGHIICKECVQLFGDRKGQGLFNVHRCPIHPTPCHWKTPMQIELKPEEAGIRILCLDGGGVRGIIELTILREIERALGDHIPIQNFFDLIVGTSAGGIIALGLGVKNWPVTKCTSYFKDFCKHAFTKRAPRVFNALNIMRGKGVYKSKTLESALESVFDSNSVLYDGMRHTKKRSIRVAVTTTLARDDRAAVLSNYNTERRSESRKYLYSPTLPFIYESFPEYSANRATLVPYVFVKPQDPTREIKVWEAARATSAAPPYFKPFTHKKTMCAYTDGAIHHHCPILIADQERRLLWEDVKDWAPDIVLSIGSGVKSTNEIPSSPETMSLSASDDFINRISKPQRTVAGLGYLWRTANKIIERQLDCEDTWRRYSNLNKSSKNKSAYGDDNRNIRLNVYFANQRPSFDDVESLEDMEQLGMFMAQENHDEIQNVVEKLIASCFYFEMLGPAFRNMQSQQYQCKGKIRCRFHNDPNDIQGLGKILLKYYTNTFSPCFLIKENYGSDYEKQYITPFPITIIKDMVQSSLFNSPEEIHIEASDPSSLTNISLYLHSENFGTPHEISGFPRDLCAVGGFVMPDPEISGEDGETENAQENESESKFTSEHKEGVWKKLNAERQSFNSEPDMRWTTLDMQETVRRAKSVNGHRENESQVSFHS
ncbi:acyl transferase/acyl hydrolase/lysophospholipase [Trichoderma pleuroticola]